MLRLHGVVIYNPLSSVCPCDTDSSHLSALWPRFSSPTHSRKRALKVRWFWERPKIRWNPKMRSKAARFRSCRQARRRRTKGHGRKKTTRFVYVVPLHLKDLLKRAGLRSGPLFIAHTQEEVKRPATGNTVEESLIIGSTHSGGAV